MPTEFDNLDPRLERMIASLREASGPGPGFDARVMARVRAAGSPPTGWRWLLAPVTLRVRPVAVLATAALVALAVIGTMLMREGATTATVATAPAAPTSVVRFVIAAPGAVRVNLVGGFNDWDAEATPLVASADRGVWTVEVPLPAGRHEYAFVVDGREWRPDPAAPESVDGEYGAPNSVVTVVGSS